MKYSRIDNKEFLNLIIPPEHDFILTLDDIRCRWYESIMEYSVHEYVRKQINDNIASSIGKNVFGNKIEWICKAVILSESLPFIVGDFVQKTNIRIL